jgi:hypothetical protein
MLHGTRGEPITSTPELQPRIKSPGPLLERRREPIATGWGSPHAGVWDPIARRVPGSQKGRRAKNARLTRSAAATLSQPRPALSLRTLQSAGGEDSAARKGGSAPLR